MRRWRALAILAAVAVLAAILGPARLSAPDLDRSASALALAGPAAGAAIALAVGRPSLLPGVLAAAAAYTSAALAIRGVPVPVAVLAASAAAAAAATLTTLLTARLDVIALLAATLLVAVTLGAVIQALPDQSGGQAGLGPAPPLGSPLAHGDVVHLTAVGDFHALLVVALIVAALTTLLLSGRTGALWRAVGSDRDRAAASRLRPLRSELIALTVAGALSGLGGALGAHIGGVATPEQVSPDVVALPLLAALLAGRANAVGAVAAAVITSVLGQVLLPDLSWRGPPSATAVALGLLGIAVVASLLPGGAAPGSRKASEIDADAAWPLPAAGLTGAALAVDDLDVRVGRLILLRGLSLRAAAGTVHGLVGPNGAGKSSVLRALAHRQGRVVLTPPGRIVLQPQAGGGFGACTAEETFWLTARAAGAGREEAGLVASRWLDRLGLEDRRETVCADLAAGQRRLVDLVRCILSRPAVLLCDEPLAGLDRSSRAAAESLVHAVAAAGLTVVITEHDRAAVARLATSSTELTRTDLSPVPAEMAP